MQASSKAKLLFFGNERLATGLGTDAPVLRALIAAGYEIEAVIANHQEVISRQKRDLEIGPIAHARGIPVILPGHKIELAKKVKKHQTQAAILVAFGKIIPQDVIDMFPKGIINIHPSLLPKLRGSTPIETAILEGLNETGVSLMKLSAKMDAGPVYAQQAVKLTGRETKAGLADTLGQLGAKLFTDNLEAILSGELKAKAQDESQASYCKMISKGDGLVDFAKPAEQNERQVRAYAGWPKSRANVFGQDVVITNARLAKDEADGALVMQCQPGWLEITKLTGPSGRTMSGADFMRGYKKS